MGNHILKEFWTSCYHQGLLMGFHVDTSYVQLFSSHQDRLPVYTTLRESGGYFHQKGHMWHKWYIYFTELYFDSVLKTDFQPASMQRPTLHLDPWVTDLSTHLPRIPRHVKVSKYHTLIDSESYFLPLCSLRVSVLRLTNWGGAAGRARSCCVEDLVPPLRHQDPGV